MSRWPLKHFNQRICHQQQKLQSADSSQTWLLQHLCLSAMVCKLKLSTTQTHLPVLSKRLSYVQNHSALTKHSSMSSSSVRVQITPSTLLQQNTLYRHRSSCTRSTSSDAESSQALLPLGGPQASNRDSTSTTTLAHCQKLSLLLRARHQLARINSHTNQQQMP